METRENIWKELQGIAPTLAKMEKRNFYSVPENYFLDFKNGLLETVKLSEAKQVLKTLAPELLKLEKKQQTEIPANYFSSFSGDLMKKMRAAEVNAELQQIAPTLSGIEEKVNLYEVPANYFNAFPQQMMKRIATEQKNELPSALPAWLQLVNGVLESIYARVFKPQYSFAFAGVASIVIVSVMLFTKVEKPCTELACLENAITDDELNAYFAKSPDLYQEEVFEQDFTNKTIEEQAFKEVLNSVSDQDLDKAILD